MSSNLSPFRIDILNAQNQKLGSGPLENVISITDTVSLDNIGTLDFTIPASNTKNAFIQTGVKFDIFSDGDYLGRYLFKSKQINDDNGEGTLTVSCYDQLKNLTFVTCGFNRYYTYDDISTIISDIIGLVSGFSAEITETGSATLALQGESVFRAIDEIRDRQGSHFRLKQDGYSPVLEFGPFGELSPIQFEQSKGQNQADFQRNQKLAVITNAVIIEESDDIFNKLIPVGGGQGVSQLTIERATLGSYTTQSESNADASLRYYIADSTSITNYGERVKIIQYPQINPITTSDNDIINAANTLKLTAETQLRRNKSPRKEYQLTVVGLRETLRVGDKIKVRYFSERNGVPYISIDDTFWVMDITTNRNVSGDRVFNINIATIDDRRTSDQDVIIEVVRDLRDIGVHIPATITYSPVGPYVKRIRGDTVEANRVSPSFVVRIAEEVLYLNSAVLRFTTSPLKSDVSAAAAASGGGSTETSSGGGGSTTTSTGSGILNTGFNIAVTEYQHYHSLATHTHDVTISSHTHDVAIPSHTHTINITYGVFENTVYPQDIYIYIDGVDVTTALGGPFAPSNAGVEEEVDITTYLVNSPFGLKYNHTIEFVSTAVSSGEVEFEVDMRVTALPIRLS